MKKLLLTVFILFLTADLGLCDDKRQGLFGEMVLP